LRAEPSKPSVAAQLRGAERKIENKAKQNEAMRACFTRGKGGHAIATLRNDDPTKLLENIGTFRECLRGTAREREFVCGRFASHFAVVIIRWFL
jgi:hypothetical protein